MLSQRCDVGCFVGQTTFLSYVASLKAKNFPGSIHEPSEKHTVVTPTFVGVDMIKRLQILFEQMLNISRRESELRNAAHSIFASRCELPTMVELPACWRRKSRPRKFGQIDK